MNIGLGIGIPFAKSQIWLSLFDPSKLFTAGVNGVWYDPSDITTLYQNAAGTLPVTAVEQPVGLMLDKSKGLVLGPELVAPINFTSGWSSSGAAVTFDNPSSFTAAGVANVFRTYFTVGVWYKVVVKATFTGGIVLYNSNTATNQIGPGSIASGTEYTFYFLAVATQLNIRATSAAIVNIDNISVRELPGNHAFNSSGNSANFPVLSARYNLLTKTEDFSDAVWVKLAISAVADTLIPGTTNVAHYVRQDVTLAAPNLARVQAKANGYNWIALWSNSTQSGAYFNVLTGVIGIVSAGVTASIAPTSDGWFECTVSRTATDLTQYQLFVANSNGGAVFSGDGVSGVRFRRADLRVANDALNQPSYQRINTATDYDTVGFKPYLKFNGTNQWLQTNSIDFTYGDKMFVSAGVRKLSDVSRAIVTELGASPSTNFFNLEASGPSAGANYGSLLAGSAITSVSGTTFTSPTTNVVTIQYDISQATRNTELLMRVNGAIPTLTYANASNAGTGNYGNYPLYIGARAGSSLWFNGRLYGMVVAGKSTSTSEITNTENYLNQKTGAY